MPLAGYHHLPQVPVMGRNVRTAQSKSSVKTSIDPHSEHDNTTMVQLDGESKIVKLLVSDNSELTEKAIDGKDQLSNEFGMANGVDAEIQHDNSHDSHIDVTSGDDKTNGSLLPPVLKKKRGRKKKVRCSDSQVPDNPSSMPNVLNQSADSSDLNSSQKEEIRNGLDSDHVPDGINKSNVEMHVAEAVPLEKTCVMKKKRGRKKKIRKNSAAVDTVLSGESDLNKHMDLSDFNARAKVASDESLNHVHNNSVMQSDVEQHSPGKRKRVSRNSVEENIAMNMKASQRSGNQNSLKEMDCEGANLSQQIFKHSPRCVMIMPAEVPSEIHLEKLKAMDATSYDLQHPRLWQYGDMLWARVSGHPYWPCMISKCPFTQMITRIKGDVKILRSYHVQFFGDDCERGWINEPALIPFKGRADFLEKACQETLKPVKKGKSSHNPFKVNNARSHAWNIAVEEAEAALTLSLKDRLEQYTFEYVFIDNAEKLKKNVSQLSLPSATSTPIASGKRKRKDSPSMSSQGQSKAKKQKLDKSASVMEDTSFDEYYAKHRTAVMEKHPDWDMPVVFEHLRYRWSLFSPKASKQSSVFHSPSKRLSSPVLPDGEKRLKRPTKKIVESLLQERIVGECKTKLKVSPPEPRKRGRPRKIPEPVLPATDPPASVNSDEQGTSDVERLEVKPKAAVAEPLSARKLSQDSESSTEGKKRVKEVEPYELEIFKLQSTSRIEKENICSVCEKNGELLECVGTCGQFFHPSCCGSDPSPANEFKCQECTSGVHSCFACKKGGESIKKCSVSQCGKYYHDECIRTLKFARVISESKGFVCPLHICATCAVENVRNPKATKGRLYRCVRCPAAFHFGDFCLSAGSKNLGGVYIVCSDHFQRNKSFSQHTHVNITWCFRCSKGGTLLCCDTCPASYHAECVKVEKTPDEAWYCEDCVAGRKLLYGSIVWVKVGNYRWWPGEICHPRHVPLNIQEKTHQIGEFPVRFFGSHDFYWIHRGRVFLFEEGDKASRDSSSRGLFKVYMRGVKEATEAFKLWKAAKAKKEEQEQERNDKKPSQFKFIKNNVPIGSVQICKAEMSEISRCECTYDQEEPCSSDCLNRMVMYECHPSVCPAKEKCNNQRFQKRQHAQCEPFRAEGRGWGLRSAQDLKKGQFVVEYVGDLIDEEECKKRIQQSHEDNVTNFYMLTMDKNRIIDAGPKGNYSRFMNHSCCPNMETQKWMVNGDIRVGLFALCDIPSGTELVFNYNLECLGNEKTACACGADNCSGFLGVRPKTAAAIANEKKVKDLKKKRKKKKFDAKKEYEDDCFRCGEGGELVMCDRIKCPKVYHLQCLNLTKPPSGKWACPWHHCDECGKGATVLCSECPNSYCAIHASDNIKEMAGCQVCCDHTDLLEDLSKSIKEDKFISYQENGLEPSHGQFSDLEKKKNCAGIAETRNPINTDTTLVNGETHDMTKNEASMKALPTAMSSKAETSGHGKKLSMVKQSHHVQNGERQPGLSRKRSSDASSGICRTKARYKSQLSLSASSQDVLSSTSKNSKLRTILQMGETAQDSEDNDSISDLVIDIP